MFLTFSVISFRARRRWHSANAAAETCPKSFRNDAKIHPKSIKNPSKIDQSGAQERQNRQNDVQERILEKGPFQDPPGGGRVQARTAPLGRHLGDFGRHFGHRWAPRGSQNRAFWHQEASKVGKMKSRMRHQKEYEFSLEFILKNVRF